MFRWGVIGPGAIANAFANAMQMVDDGKIVAVASRAAERAAAFGDRFAVPRRYEDLGEFAADPDIDVIYIATPVAHHEEHTLMMLEAGKHVLCEKPFAVNAHQAERMAAAARSRGLFLMDAMWSRFIPAYRSLVHVLESGRIGAPLLVEGDFGYRVPIDPESRRFNLELGGGAMLDLGIYPLQLCSLVFGPPDHIAAAAVIGETGVDEYAAAVLRHPGGKLGVVKAAIRVGMTCTARIGGTDGSIDIPAFMNCPGFITVTTAAGPAVIDGPFVNGMQFEIAEVHRCLTEGRTESPVIPLDETISLAMTLDTIRAQIGVAYPNE